MKKIEKYYNLINEHLSEFEKYYNSLISFNEKVNLTAITNQEDVFIKHFLDSILSIEEIKENSNVIDIGAGAGFPSLPIKIVRPDIKLTMLDSLNKRINFLNQICSELNIESTNVHARAEDYIKNNREKFDIALARAVARLNTLVEYLLPYVKIGGLVLAYKGSNYLEELSESKRAIELLGGKYLKTISFNLPENKGERNIIVIEKIKPTPKSYPRAKNLPKIQPIK